MAEPVPVLYVMGHGWSGSTLLGNLLNELPGFFHAGELRRLWGEALVRAAPCGCGVPVPECPVWSKVLDHPLVNWLGEDVEWKGARSGRDRRIVTALTLPLLAGYRYGLRTGLILL